MAAVAQAGSGRMYSWWWDSHISPKNSKWLQENLTDMDTNVKTMIKLIEEDADSFARRAEMYYKKRPELMKLVEEFYRAYRALAERYDHATGVIRQAQRTMVEAFPNQVPFMLVDDSIASPAPGDQLISDLSTPVRSFLDPGDLPKDGLRLPDLDHGDAKRYDALTEEPDFTAAKKDLKHPSDHSMMKDHVKFAEGRARKGLKFDKTLDNEVISETNESHKDHNQILATAETHDSQEILLLKKALAEVKAQKDAGLIQYQESLVKLSLLESEISRAEENSRGLSERATQAEAEVQDLKEALVKLEAEKEANLEQYRQCLSHISELENNNSSLHVEMEEHMQKSRKAETEAESLKEEISKLVDEKDTALKQYMGSLQTISNLEQKLQFCEEDAFNLKERAEKAENEVETLKQYISKLIEEKDAAVLQYEQSMITISDLEQKLTSGQEEAQRLNIEIENRVASLKSAEERCIELEKSNQSLNSEVESLMLKMGSQGQELTEKQKELGRLWACIQEERLRFVEAETAFQTLQHLHAQAQDELRSLVSEMQNKVLNLMNLEAHNKNLQDQLIVVIQENKSLNELNISSSLTIEELGTEISGLKESKGKLQEEVELRVDERNALQQEIYCLKEELTVLNKQHSSVMEQVHAVGLSPEHLGSSVKELQDENSGLKETCQREKNEKVALLEKVVMLDQLLERNSMLETSLSDLNVELEAVREKIEALEDSYKFLLQENSSLIEEKASLAVELKRTTENVERISGENAVLENSLSDAHTELQVLKNKSCTLEDSLKSLENEKSIIAGNKDNLASELVSTQIRLETLEKIYLELGEKYSALEKEKEASVFKIEELTISLDVEKKKHAKFEHLSQSQLFEMEKEMNLLLEELEHGKREYDMELQNAFEYQTQMYILRKCAQDLEAKNFYLLTKNHKLSEASESLADKYTNLKQNYLNQEIQMQDVSEQASALRMGICKFFKSIDIDLDNELVDRCEQDHVSCILHKLGETQTSIHRNEEVNHLLCIELSVLVTMLHQLKMDAEHLAVEKNIIDREFRIRGDQLEMFQNENLKLNETKEELTAKIREGDHKEQESRIQMLDLEKKLSDLQGQNVQVLEEKGLLKSELFQLEEKIRNLEEENCLFCMEVVSLDLLSVLFRNNVDEKSMRLKALAENIHQLNGANSAITQRLNLTERMLDDMLIQKGLELQQLREEYEKAKIQAEASCSEQRMLIQESQWESQASKFFDEMQVSNFHQIVYEQKLLELAEACDRLVGENTSKENSVKLLNETIGALTSRNGNLNAQLAAYGLAITSLKRSISSLENRSILKVTSQKQVNGELKDAGIGNQMKESSICSNKDTSVPDLISDLQDLQRRIESIEKSVTEREQFMVQETLNVHAELESALKQIAVLKSDNSLRRRRPVSEMSELETALLTKDIMLDQVSESSPYGSSKREQLDVNNQVSESWEAADRDCSIDLKMSKSNKAVSPHKDKHPSFHRTKSVKKQKGSRLGSDIMVEKELGVDKLEISKRFMEPPQEGQKKKVLERLNSDVQKLANLQITVEDLRRKLKIIEMSKKGKSMEECEILKEQLEEADSAIMKLFDLNARVLKSIEGTPLSVHSKSSMDLDESGSIKGRKTTEQARKMSEKIGRLQMEVQKIQFVLLKLEVENDSKARTRISEARRRVLLKDYLYGAGVRSAYRRKKAAFCSCIRPQTEGD